MIELLESRLLFCSYSVAIINGNNNGNLEILHNEVFAPTAEDAIKLAISGSFTDGNSVVHTFKGDDLYFKIIRNGDSAVVTPAGWHLRVTQLLNIKLIVVKDGSEEPDVRTGLERPLIFRLQRTEDAISLGNELAIVDPSDLNRILATFRRGEAFCEVPVGRGWRFDDADKKITVRFGLAGVVGSITGTGFVRAPFYLAAKSKIKMEEGFSSVVYRDSLGFLTVGYGHKLPNNGNLEYDRDLDRLFLDDLNKAVGVAMTSVTNFVGLPLNAKLVVVDLVFNLGSLRRFGRFVEAIDCSDWLGAIKELGSGTGAGGKSLYSLQVPNRFRRNVALLASCLL